MYPVLTRTCSKHSFLKTGKIACLNFLRNSRAMSSEIELPPEPTTCCMSGCTNCVWVTYAETVFKLMDGNSDQVREMILSKIEDPNLKMFLKIELKAIQYNLEKSKELSETEMDKGK